MSGRPLTKPLLLLVFYLACATEVRSEITISTLISDNMVLQLGETYRIAGQANPDQRIRLGFDTKEKSTKASKAGEWHYELPLPARVAGSHVLHIADRNKKNEAITFTNLVIGRVLIVSLRPGEGWLANKSELERLEKIDPEKLGRIRYCTITNFSDVSNRGANYVLWKQCSKDSYKDGDLALLALQYAAALANPDYVGIVQTYSEFPLKEAMRIQHSLTPKSISRSLPENFNDSLTNANRLIELEQRRQLEEKVRLKRSGQVKSFSAIVPYSWVRPNYSASLFSTSTPPASIISFEQAVLSQ